MEVLTDNRNRTVSEVRHLLSKYNGSMAETGAVSYLFDQKGVVVVPKTAVDEETLMTVVLEAGAEDIAEEDEVFEVSMAL